MRREVSDKEFFQYIKDNQDRLKSSDITGTSLVYRIKGSLEEFPYDVRAIRLKCKDGTVKNYLYEWTQYFMDNPTVTDRGMDRVEHIRASLSLESAFA